jgi:hypothetical protein
MKRWGWAVRRIRDFFWPYGFGLICSLALLAGSAPAYLGQTMAAAKWRDLLARPPAALASGLSAYDGTIPPDAPALANGFVAYADERYRAGGQGNASRWEQIGGEVTGFSLGTSVGVIRLEVGSYGFGLPFDIWPLPVAGGQLIADWDHVDARRTQGAERLRGLKSGGPVIVFGEMSGVGRVRATYVMSGTRAQRMAELQAIARGQGLGVYFWGMMIALAGVAASIGLGATAFVRSGRR